MDRHCRLLLRMMTNIKLSLAERVKADVRCGLLLALADATAAALACLLPCLLPLGVR